MKKFQKSLKQLIKILEIHKREEFLLFFFMKNKTCIIMHVLLAKNLKRLSFPSEKEIILLILFRKKLGDCFE